MSCDIEIIDFYNMYLCLCRPAGSRDCFYVETGGGAEMDGMSEATTVESTHPGSDDAIGPNLPAHAYGSRGESHHHSKPMDTIQEQSLVSNMWSNSLISIVKFVIKTFQSIFAS